MSVYPTNETLPVEETANNLVNRMYHGYTFKLTVEKHLIRLTTALQESKDFCNTKIKEKSDKGSIKYWSDVLKIVETYKVEPHPCNIDYDIHMMRSMSIAEIVKKYDTITIGDIKKSREIITP